MAPAPGYQEFRSDLVDGSGRLRTDAHTMAVFDRRGGVGAVTRAWEREGAIVLAMAWQFSNVADATAALDELFATSEPLGLADTEIDARIIEGMTTLLGPRNGLLGGGSVGAFTESDRLYAVSVATNPSVAARSELLAVLEDVAGR